MIIKIIKEIDIIELLSNISINISPELNVLYSTYINGEIDEEQFKINLNKFEFEILNIIIKNKNKKHYENIQN